MMAGNEFAIAAFCPSQFGRLSTRTHAEAAASMGASLGKGMPFWYALLLLFLIGAAFEHRPISHGFEAHCVCRISLGRTITFTVTMLVPINNRIAKMIPRVPTTGWLKDRVHWDLLHRIRVAVLVVSILLLLTAY